MKNDTLIKNIGLLILLVNVIGCDQPQTSTKELTSSSEEQEPTKPEETEVWEPVPNQVTFDENNIPSDAIVLFDGKNFDAWEVSKEGVDTIGWKLNEDGSATVVPGSGDIQTKEKFGDVQLHIEWSAPDEVLAESQLRGNSGIFFQNRYEVQVLDSYENPTYANGQAASVYKQHVPLVNAMKSREEWQIYDIIYHAPEFDQYGEKLKSATVTVLHNGVLVQDHVEILGTTEYIGWPKNEAHGEDVIKLQDHNDGNNHVSYRNIWIRKL